MPTIRVPASLPPAPAVPAVEQPRSALAMALLEMRGAHQEALTDDDVRAYLAFWLSRRAS